MQYKRYPHGLITSLLLTFVLVDQLYHHSHCKEKYETRKIYKEEMHQCDRSYFCIFFCTRKYGIWYNLFIKFSSLQVKMVSACALV
jgi:hypothetical protein